MFRFVNVYQHARGIKLWELNDENKFTWPPSETNPKDADFLKKVNPEPWNMTVSSLKDRKI